MKLVTVSKYLLLLSLLLVMGCSCATKEELASVRMQSEQAKEAADEALQAAREARRSADEARMTSGKTEELVNRSFKKSMYK